MLFSVHFSLKGHAQEHLGGVDKGAERSLVLVLSGSYKCRWSRCFCPRAVSSVAFIMFSCWMIVVLYNASWAVSGLFPCNHPVQTKSAWTWMWALSVLEQELKTMAESSWVGQSEELSKVSVRQWGLTKCSVSKIPSCFHSAHHTLLSSFQWGCKYCGGKPELPNYS